MAVPKRKTSSSAAAETRRNLRRRSSAGVIKNERQKQQQQQQQLKEEQEEQSQELSTYDRIVDGIPISRLRPDYSRLQNKSSVLDSHILRNALIKSRYAFLTGKMFDVFWTRPVRGKRLAQGEVNARDRMTKFCECDITVGIHTFDVKLFLVRDSISQAKSGPTVKKPVQAGTIYSTPVAQLGSPSTGPPPPVAGSPALASESTPTRMTQSPNPPQYTAAQSGSTPAPSGAPTGGSASPNPTSGGGPAVTPISTPAPPPAANNEIPLSEENRIMVAKLHAIAKTDVNLSSLMKVVAAGQATHDQLLLFQRYITMARNSDMNSYYGNRKPSSGDKQQQQRSNKGQSPGESKAHTLVFEFKENPSDRFMLPKMSIIEPLSNGDILVSFLLLSRSNTKGDESGTGDQKQQQDSSSSSIKQEEEPKEDASSTIFYEPVTMRLSGIPQRLIDTVIKSVNEPSKVQEYMSNILSNDELYKRSPHFWVWYHIDPTDLEAVEASKHVPQHPLAIATASSGYKRKYLPKKKRPSSIVPDDKRSSSTTSVPPTVSNTKPEQVEQKKQPQAETTNIEH